jgi:hypothetical protein
LSDALVQPLAVCPECSQVLVEDGHVQVEVRPVVVLAAADRASQPCSRRARIRAERLNNPRQQRVTCAGIQELSS